MKLSNLWQPKHPLFWLSIALNALSAIFAVIVQTQPLSGFMRGAITLIMLMNAVLGLWFAWRLANTDKR
jgi:hypothetical protein